MKTPEAVRRHNRGDPEWQILQVQAVDFIGEDGDYLTTSALVDVTRHHLVAEQACPSSQR